MSNDDKFIKVTPGNVRGLGNIIIPKSLSDFKSINGKITSNSNTEVSNLNLTTYTLSSCLLEMSLATSVFMGDNFIVQCIAHDTEAKSFNIYVDGVLAGTGNSSVENNVSVANITIDSSNLSRGNHIIYCEYDNNILSNSTSIYVKLPLRVRTVWDDSNNNDGLRPNYVTLSLYEIYENSADLVDSIRVSSENNWQAVFEIEPEKEYTIRGNENISGYTYSYEEGILTYTHEIITTTKNVQVQFTGENNINYRPENLTINLLKNGVIVDTATASTASGWNCSFSNVQVYEQGATINYTVSTSSLDSNWVTTVSGSSDTFVLMCALMTANLNIQLVFVNAPPSLLENAGSVGIVVTSDNEDNRINFPISITYSQFTGGNYNLANVLTGIYSASITSNIPNDEVTDEGKYTLIQQGTVLSISNELSSGDDITLRLAIVYEFEEAEPQEEPDTQNIPVTIVWNDNNNEDGNRPSSVTVNLYAGGNIVDTHVITNAMNWTYTYEDLPIYNNGRLINYSITINPCEFYLNEINGFNITMNYYQPMTTSSVIIVWDDDDNLRNLRPSSVRMYLTANGTDYRSVILTEGNGWQVTVTDLHATLNNESIAYDWVGECIGQYDLTSKSEVDGLTTFTYAPNVNSRPSLTVYSEKSAISYDDHESVTIYALCTTSNKTPEPMTAAGCRVRFSVIDSMQNIIETGVGVTGKNGIATFIYDSQGLGDVTISAEYAGLTESCVIEDCFNYDDASSDKSSSISVYQQKTVNYALIHDSENSRYEFSAGSCQDKFQILQFGQYASEELMMEMDVMYGARSSPHNGLMNLRTDSNQKADGCVTYGGQVGTWTSQQIVRKGKAGSCDTKTGSNASPNVWYTYKISIMNGSICVEIINKSDNSIVLTNTWSDTFGIQNYYANFGFYGIYSQNVVYFKNLKIKKLKTLEDS